VKGLPKIISAMQVMATPMPMGSSAPLKPVRYNRLVQQDISKPMDGNIRTLLVYWRHLKSDA
jgi:hypothetical protein